MADDMLSFFDDLAMFFTEQHIPVTDFSKKHIDRLMTEYLNYEDLTDAECSMAYQMLLDFADFFLKKNSNAAFLKDFLEKEKETIYSYWLLDTDSEGEFQEIFNNFDLLYAMEQPEMQNKKPDFNEAIRFIDDLHCLLDTIRTLAAEAKKTNPTISDDELQKTVTADCSTQDKKIVGGGFLTDNRSNSGKIAVAFNGPISDTRWQVIAGIDGTTTSDESFSIQAVAICINAL